MLAQKVQRVFFGVFLLCFSEQHVRSVSSKLGMLHQQTLSCRNLTCMWSVCAAGLRLIRQTDAGQKKTLEQDGALRLPNTPVSFTIKKNKYILYIINLIKIQIKKKKTHISYNDVLPTAELNPCVLFVFFGR